MLRNFLLLLSILFCSSVVCSGWERSYVLPAWLEGTESPVLLLNGVWDFKYSQEGRWTDIRVPGEVAMQGFAIMHDTPFFYRKSFEVPADYAGKRIFLRFDGVYSHARLSVNGNYVREHHGGFTRWETDITSWVHIGKKNTVMLEVTDRLDDISYASGYAHHPVGGILRDVTLFALPEPHLYDINIMTSLDSLYQDAGLEISCGFDGQEHTEVELLLKDKYSKSVPLKQSRFTLSRGMNNFVLPVRRPLKWDAEHPNLYELTVNVSHKGKKVCHFTREVGFREVRISGNRMLVNGHPVKLRGACRHDIHPILGRTTTAELDSLDALLFKQANMNFVRTSHYPPTERFLSFCDRYGIYVECESAVCFVDTYRQKNYRPGDSQDNPVFSHQYLDQCKEMVNSFSSHPSIILWSIGNESRYGENFKKSYEWIKQTDHSRPVIFSWPGTAKVNKVYDVLSMHYPNSQGDVSNFGVTIRNFDNRNIPVLFDEWAHPACYTYTTLQTDPNIREFWGKSLDLMWSRLFDASGGLGGAVWGYVDETFALPAPKVGEAYWKDFARTSKPTDCPGNCIGYGEWGIVDVWRRPKPEYWSTKKAYSPIRLLTSANLPFKSGRELILTVHNRFDHTKLDEIRASYTYKGVTKPLELDAVNPHDKGMVLLPPEQWEEGEKVVIEFSTVAGEIIDVYCFTLGTERITYPPLLSEHKMSVIDRGDRISVTGRDFDFPFNKATGLIVNATVGGQVLIEKGPFLNLELNLNHLTGAEVRKKSKYFMIDPTDWKMTSFDYRQQDKEVSVYLSGSYQEVKVDFHIRITAVGEISVSYKAVGIPNGFLRESGISFYLPENLDHLEWKRKGYWNYYPDGEFAGNEGQVLLYASKQACYGEKPVQPWYADTHDYYYWGDAGTDCRRPLTRMAKGMKENIYYYILSAGKEDAHQLSVISQEASVACRVNKPMDEQLVLYANNRWDYPEIAWGNYCKTLEAVPCYGCVELRIR